MSRALVFTRTTVYVHSSIPARIAALSASELDIDPTDEWPALLDPYDVVVFLNTSGRVFDDAGRARLASYVSGGGGFVACTALRGRDAVQAEITTILKPRWVGEFITATFTGTDPADLRLSWRTDIRARQRLEQRLFGKRILFTNRNHWPVRHRSAAAPVTVRERLSALRLCRRAERPGGLSPRQEPRPAPLSPESRTPP